MVPCRPIPRRHRARVAGRPLFPAVYEDELSYDAGSQILSKVDRRLGAYLPRRDRRYAYDGLDRLVEEQPGRVPCLPKLGYPRPAEGRGSSVSRDSQ